jgi:hypothetical protein
VLAALALCAGCSVASDVDVHNPPQTWSGDRSPVQVVSALIGGKNVFIPSSIVVISGAGQQLSIFNTTEIAHGFRIADLGIEAVLAPGQETTLTLPPLAGGRIHRIDCHLHPPHRTAVLVVLPAE